MNITYDYYRTFYYVAKYGSFTKAAEIMGNSQPNITRAMNNLESQLGVNLFVRSRRGVVLTPEGERLFTRVSLAFEQLQIAESEIEASKNYETGIISIGVSDIAMYEILYPILPEFRKKYPDLVLHISNESTLSAIKRLKEGIIDFALVTSPMPDESVYEVEKIKEIRDYAVVSKKYSGMIPDSIRVRDMNKYSLIMLSKGTATRFHYDDFFAKYGVELVPQMTASNINQIISMVKVGLGVGFVPESVINMDDSFEKLNLKENIPTRDICIVRNKDRVTSRAAQILIDHIKEII